MQVGLAGQKRAWTYLLWGGYSILLSCFLESLSTVSNCLDNAHWYPKQTDRKPRVKESAEKNEENIAEV